MISSQVPPRLLFHPSFAARDIAGRCGGGIATARPQHPQASDTGEISSPNVTSAWTTIAQQLHRDHEPELEPPSPALSDDQTDVFLTPLSSPLGINYPIDEPSPVENDLLDELRRPHPADVFVHEFAQEEQPPSYIAATGLPTYDHVSLDRPLSPPSAFSPTSIPLNDPVLTYHLRQQTRTTQILVPFGPSPHVSYRINTRLGPKLFSKKKADITVTKCSNKNRRPSITTASTVSATQDARAHRPSPPSRSLSLSRTRTRRWSSAALTSTSDSNNDPNLSSDEEEDVCLTNFSNDGKLPWYPRATMTVFHRPQDPSGILRMKRPLQIQMSATNFRDWRVYIPSADSTYFWFLFQRPTCLELHPEELNGPPIARFSPSSVGSRATNGAEVGVLEVYQILDLVDGPNVEAVVASCCVAIQNLKRMGRHLWEYANGMPDVPGHAERGVRTPGTASAVASRSLSVDEGEEASESREAGVLEAQETREESEDVGRRND